MNLRRLKDTREDKDLLQKQVAIILKITRQQYGLLVELAEFYNTSTDYLLGLTNETKPYPRIK